MAEAICSLPCNFKIRLRWAVFGASRAWALLGRMTFNFLTSKWHHDTETGGAVGTEIDTLWQTLGHRRKQQQNYIRKKLGKLESLESLTLARQTVYATARNLACQWGKNSWQCAFGCVRMRVRWNSACLVVARTSKCSKKFPTVSRLVMTKLSCHFRETVNCEQTRRNYWVTRRANACQCVP